MKTTRSTTIASALMALWILGGMGTGAKACGLNWSEPKSHFNGVSFQGYVFLVEPLGQIELRDGTKLPVRAIFRSESNATSPYLGHGWDIPLLESHIVQMDELWFRVVEPTGWYRLFWRDEKNPSILHGQGGWKAQIQGNTITAWADCGSKLVFNKGRLVSMQLKEKTIGFIYEGKRISEIREGSRLLLRVEKDAFSGEVSGFRLTDLQQIRLERSGRPRIQAIDHQNLVGGVDQSLSKITHADGTVRSMEYAVDQNKNPTIKLGADRLIVWNPASKSIIQDGEWTYIIKPPINPRDSAAIGRKNAKNQREFWHDDKVNGEKIEILSDGSQIRTTQFTSGRLASRIRQRTQTVNGKTTIRYQPIYDENAKIIRMIVNDKMYAPHTDENGKFRLIPWEEFQAKQNANNPAKKSSI